MAQYRTRGGITVEVTETPASFPSARNELADSLNATRGLLLYSNYEFPGRYSRFDLGFLQPPLVFESIRTTLELRALNDRGRVLLDILAPRLEPREPEFGLTRMDPDVLSGEVHGSDTPFPEEQRTRRRTVFTFLRRLLDVLACDGLSHLGLYGAMGYDLIFQFEDIAQRLARPERQRDIVLYLPDDLVITDHVLAQSRRLRFDFSADGRSTAEMPRTGEKRPFVVSPPAPIRSDHAPGEYVDLVRKAKASFARGDLFEVVVGQEFSTPCPSTPSDICRILQGSNPSPYGFLINLGDGEYLVGASPEMFVRVTGSRVESCPISGTIARGRDALEDSQQILRLLTSGKEEAELTMCTDVDRNDKSRICKPGSVKVIGRRQIELYSRLIHTVDHIEGELRPEFDGLDAFLTHAWAVTVTGAPKRWAVKFIEDNEKSCRRWYGGAVGVFNVNGNVNTGLTLRTVHLEDGVARVRAGATLLFASAPEAEEEETVLKASAFLDAVTQTRISSSGAAHGRAWPLTKRRVFFVDHEDSFVHTLTNYFRQLGAEVITYRAGFAEERLLEFNPELVVLSPGPGCPTDFGVARTVDLCVRRSIPLFGVCLGLQGIVEYFGGKLHVLPVPCHGRRTPIRLRRGKLFDGLPEEIEVGRYHSLYAKVNEVPQELGVTADEGSEVTMAVEHKTRAIWAVQFHPESVMTADDDLGLRIIANVLR